MNWLASLLGIGEGNETREFGGMGIAVYGLNTKGSFIGPTGKYDKVVDMNEFLVPFMNYKNPFSKVSFQLGPYKTTSGQMDNAVNSVINLRQAGAKTKENKYTTDTIRYIFGKDSSTFHVIKNPKN
jgi:hypothetical protein